MRLSWKGNSISKKSKKNINIGEDMETQRERHETVRIPHITNLKTTNNYVLCRRLEHHFSDKTKGGLIKVAESYNRDQYLTQNVERVFEVVKLPDYLEEDRMFWDTQIDLKIGDRVIVDYFDSLNSKVIKTDDGEEYRLILYYGIITAIRGGKIIPLNGYLLFTPIYSTLKTALQLSPGTLKTIDYRFGIVEHISYPNKYYNKGEKKNLDKGINIRKGDKIVFLNEFRKFAPILEDKIYKTLDKSYYYCHRYKVGGIVKN